jgi:putative ABC transport system substrate-binding protein
MMKRRNFIILLGGAAAWSIAARAQQPSLPVVGLLMGGGNSTGYTGYAASIRSGMTEVGYSEGRDFTFENRAALGRYDQLPALAAELVRRRVAVIVANGGLASVRAAKAATTTIPIVFLYGGDPVDDGLVASLNKPGGNLTGVSLVLNPLGAKRLQLLQQLIPSVTTVGVLLNPNNARVEIDKKDIVAAAGSLGLQIQIVGAGTEADFEAAFATLVRLRVGALFVNSDTLFLNRVDQLVALAARHALPAIYQSREFTAAGGLISYGPSSSDGSRQAGVYVGRILKGEKAADLPVLQPTKFELVINLKTAKALGLTVSRDMQLLADEVIE